MTFAPPSRRAVLELLLLLPIAMAVSSRPAVAQTLPEKRLAWQWVCRYATNLGTAAGDWNLLTDATGTNQWQGTNPPAAALFDKSARLYTLAAATNRIQPGGTATLQWRTNAPLSRFFTVPVPGLARLRAVPGLLIEPPP